MITLAPRKGTVALAVLTLSAGLVSTAPAGGVAAASSHRPLYTLSDSGEHVTVEKSHEIRLDLRTDWDGGYRWVTGRKSGSSLIKVIGRTVHPYKHKKSAVGYPYHTIYVLKVVSYGRETIRFTERRPFDASDIVKRFTLKIHVPAPAKPQPAPPARHACTTTSSGSSVQRGEFCLQASYGQTGWDANGTRYVCEGDTTHPHCHPH